jgi:DNA topoisomerase-2
MSQYKKYTPLQHVLARPDTYVGSLNPDVSKQWVYEEDTMKMKQTSFVGGLFKIFDEILVNALDQTQVDSDVDKITVDVDITTGSVCVSNTGKGIPIEQHPEYKVWIPELIFGELLTSSNYDDTQERTTGGRNGYGAKLTNIFSKRFVIETVHKGQRYVQEWTDNMSNKTKPKITKATAAKKGLTKITFFPDFARFGMESFVNEDIVSLFERRTYDAAACSPANVKVFYNGKNVGIKTFEKYVDSYIGNKKETTRVFEVSEDGRWEIALAQSDGGFQQVSFVNGIHTSLGGAHVEYVSSQLIKRITEHILSKHKDLKLKPQHIKDHMFLFVRSTLTNPSFSSQTKTECTSRWKDFGTNYRVSDDFVKKVLKLPFINDIVALVKHKEQRELNKTDGKKQSVIKGIPKLEDANKAGTVQSSKCTLILTEGDSAKTFAISGLGVVGRDYYGVFPLKGKLLNVRDASAKQLLNNEEIVNIKQILGLQNNKEYTSTKDLRYGHVMILTDADVDGSHIKGLFINFIHAFWPSLLENVPHFLTSMRTPILKCVKGGQTRAFYTKQDYDQWKAHTRDHATWKVKYYKGLGTSSANEAREYFRNLDTNKVEYRFDKTQSVDIDLAFKKTLTHERKRWISQASTVLDTSENIVSVTDFIHKDLIWFSVSDNVRSIPCMVDGLKPSQRKVLYACRKRSGNSEIKVSQLSGFVSTETAYHHGEQSLMGTIINMAQDYVGSNNLHLLLPKGQFGTRLMGGKDAASPRYIFTQLSAEADKLFHKDDDPLLTYLEDDGTPIEPAFFVPTLPMVLVNGATGIGTGYSTQVPCYNPSDLQANVMRVLQGQEQQPMTPWYHGFKGKITEDSRGKYTTHGVFSQKNNQEIEITELPIGTWTNDYKEFIDGLLVQNEIRGYENHSTETDVRFVIRLAPTSATAEHLEKQFKLTSTINTTNMHLFDANGKIRLYESPETIVAEFVQLRLKYYAARKTHLLNTWNASLGELSEKHRFIQLVMDDKILVFRKSRAEIAEQLRAHAFDKQMDETLLGIKISAFTAESLRVLDNKIAEYRTMIRDLADQTPSQMWTRDLSRER